MKTSLKVIRLFAALVRALPIDALQRLARLFGWIGYRAYGPERELALRNIRVGFPSESDTWQKQVVLRSFQHTVLTALEFLRSPNNHFNLRTAIGLKNREYLTKLVDGGRGVVFVSGHYGNTAAIPLALKEYYDDLAYVAHRPTRRIGWAVAQWRAYRDLHLKPASGIHSLESSISGAMKASHLLKRGSSILVLADITWGTGDLPVTFLGTDFNFSRLPASLALIAGAPLVPIMTIRRRDGCYEVVVGEAIEYPHAPSRRNAQQMMTQAFARILERHVRSCPAQWCWTHRYGWRAAHIGNAS